MLGSLVVVGVGFVFTRTLPPIQGTVGMTLFGGGFLIGLAMWAEGVRGHELRSLNIRSIIALWWKGREGLDPRRLTPSQRKGMLRHSLTSSLMKVGGPLAFAEIGAGPYSSITTMGSLLAGILTWTVALTWTGALLSKVAPSAKAASTPRVVLTSAKGRWLRVIVLLGVLQATNVLAGAGSVSLVGMIAAVTAATHPFDVPGQSKLMGEKRDQCIGQANVICMIVVLPVCVPLAGHLGMPIGDWKWGPAELVAMALAGLFATALAAVMQTRASKYISKADMGAWSATAPAVQPVVALLVAPVVSLFLTAPMLMPSAQQWAAFGIVTIASTLAVKVDSSAAQAADATEKKRGEALPLE